MATVQGKVMLTDAEVYNALVTCCEGGSNYWIDQASHRPYNARVDGELILPVTFYVSDMPQKSYTLTREDCDKGALVMLQKYPRQYAEEFPTDRDDYNGDASSADVWLQCCLFGEAVFG